MSISGWMDKVYAMEYDSALKRMGILTQATRGMEPENIMLSEIKQSPKHKVYDPT